MLSINEALGNINGVDIRDFSHLLVETKILPIYQIGMGRHIRRRSYRAVVDSIMRLYVQHGGGRVRCDTKEGRISVDGHTYRWRCSEDADGETLVFSGGNARPCFVLHIFPQTNTATLAEITRVPRCAINTDAPTQVAGLAAFALAKERGVKHINMTDNSSKPSPSGDKFSVADTSFLTTGKTWYESFLPIRPVPSLAPSIHRWRQIVQDNKWDDVYACLTRVRPGVVIPVDITDIDGGAPGSAMLVLRRIKSARTDFFSTYRYDLPNCCGIGSLHGSEWEADL